jgi:hypothetical protein
MPSLLAMSHVWLSWPLQTVVHSFLFLIRLIKLFLIVLVVMFACYKNDSSVINSIYSEAIFLVVCDPSMSKL